MKNITLWACMTIYFFFIMGMMAYCSNVVITAIKANPPQECIKLLPVN